MTKELGWPLLLGFFHQPGSFLAVLIEFTNGSFSFRVVKEHQCLRRLVAKRMVQLCAGRTLITT
jgi:hypothetical protein